MPKLIDENDANEFIPLNEAGRYVPGRPHRATIWRWCLRGIRRHGEVVKLGTVAIGGRRFTTREHIAEFLAACNPDAPRPAITDSFRRRAEAAGRVLESLGVK